LRERVPQPTLAAMKTDIIDPAVASPSELSVPDPHAPIPRQILYIIGNEGCERFSFYGIRNILTVLPAAPPPHVGKRKRTGFKNLFA
jgi:hypothetical protein